MVENFDIHHVEYALWNQNFDRHSYRGMKMDDVKIKDVFQPKGVMPHESEFPKPLAPVDDLAPVTVITYVSKPVKGKITVRGTTSDTGAVKRVQVNGHEA